MITDRLKCLFQFLEDSPNDAFLLFAIAKEYEKSEDQENALAYYQKLLSEQPNYVGTYYHLGKLYEVQNQEEKALAIYTKGMEVARQEGDQHAFAELAGAKLGVE